MLTNPAHIVQVSSSTKSEVETKHSLLTLQAHLHQFQTGSKYLVGLGSSLAGLL